MSGTSGTSGQDRARFSFVKPPSRGEQTAGGTLPGAAALPQVNLLPAAVRDQRALRRTKLILLVAVGAVLIVAMLGYAGSMMMAGSARAELDEVQNETLRLRQQQATYSEVPRIKADIGRSEDAQRIGMGKEVLWAGYLASISSKLPEGAVITTLSSKATSPVIDAEASGDELVATGIGTISIELRVPTLDGASGWVDGLDAIEGLRDARMSSEAIAAESGEVFYLVSTTVQVDVTALSHRFLEPKETEK